MSTCDTMKAHQRMQAPSEHPLPACGLQQFVGSNQLGARARIAAAALIAGYACRTLLEANAQREVPDQAGQMMDSALAIRDYTANEIASWTAGMFISAPRRWPRHLLISLKRTPKRRSPARTVNGGSLFQC